MKKLVMVVALMLSTVGVSGQVHIDYKGFLKNTEVALKTKKDEIKGIKKQLGVNKNDVSLHKLLVKKTVELDSITSRHELLKKASTLSKKLEKENDKFDKMKAKLLKLKNESENLDREILRVWGK